MLRRLLIIAALVKEAAAEESIQSTCSAAMGLLPIACPGWPIGYDKLTDADGQTRECRPAYLEVGDVFPLVVFAQNKAVKQARMLPASSSLISGAKLSVWIGCTSSECSDGDMTETLEALHNSYRDLTCFSDEDQYPCSEWTGLDQAFGTLVLKKKTDLGKQFGASMSTFDGSVALGVIHVRVREIEPREVFVRAETSPTDLMVDDPACFPVTAGGQGSSRIRFEVTTSTTTSSTATTTITTTRTTTTTTSTTTTTTTTSTSTSTTTASTTETTTTTSTATIAAWPFSLQATVSGMIGLAVLLCSCLLCACLCSAYMWHKQARVAAASLAEAEAKCHKEEEPTFVFCNGEPPGHWEMLEGGPLQLPKEVCAGGNDISFNRIADDANGASAVWPSVSRQGSPLAAGASLTSGGAIMPAGFMTGGVIGAGLMSESHSKTHDRTYGMQQAEASNDVTTSSSTLGSVVWFPTLSWANEFSSHLLGLKHNGNVYILQHSNNIGHMHVGRFMGRNCFDWFAATLQMPKDSVGQLVALQHGNAGKVLHVSGTSKEVSVGRYCDDGRISWYPKSKWPIDCITHIIAFQHFDESCVLAHDKHSSKVLIGSYVGGSAFKWHSAIDDWCGETTHLLAVQCAGDVHFLRQTSQSCTLAIGRYEGENQITWYPEIVLDAERNYITHMITWQCQGQAFLLRHAASTGATYIGRYQGGNKIIWYDMLKSGLERNATTHLLALEHPCGDVHILNHNSRTGTTVIGQVGWGATEAPVREGEILLSCDGFGSDSDEVKQRCDPRIPVVCTEEPALVIQSNTNSAIILGGVPFCTVSCGPPPEHPVFRASRPRTPRAAQRTYIEENGYT